jgi:hypothetical protein
MNKNTLARIITGFGSLSLFLCSAFMGCEPGKPKVLSANKQQIQQQKAQQKDSTKKHKELPDFSASELEEMLCAGIAMTQRDEDRRLHYVRFNLHFQDGNDIRRIMKNDHYYITKKVSDKIKAAESLAGNEQYTADFDRLWIKVNHDKNRIYTLIFEKGEKSDKIPIQKQNIIAFIKDVLSTYTSESEKDEKSKLEEMLRIGLALNRRDEERNIHYVHFNLYFQDGGLIRRVMSGNNHYITREVSDRLKVAEILAENRKYPADFDRVWVKVQHDRTDIKYTLTFEKQEKKSYEMPVSKESIIQFIKSALSEYIK